MIAVFWNDPKEEQDRLLEQLSQEDKEFLENDFEREIKKLDSMEEEAKKTGKKEAELFKEYYISTPYRQMKEFIYHGIHVGMYFKPRWTYVENFDKSSEAYQKMTEGLEWIHIVLDPNYEDKRLPEWERLYEEYIAAKKVFDVKKDIENYNKMQLPFLQLPSPFTNDKLTLPEIAEGMKFGIDEGAEVNEATKRMLAEAKLYKNAVAAHSVKEWTIRFNKKIDLSSDFKTVKIIDLKDNQEIPLLSSFTEDGRVIVFPLALYESGKEYILLISGFRSEDGSMMKEAIKMPFVFQE